MDKLDDKMELGSITQTLKEYADLRVDEYKCKGVENLSLLSNKALAALVAIMLGAVILQFAGFSIAFIISAVTGSFAVGFGAVALAFVLMLAYVYTKRDTLFIGKMVKMYSKMFFGREMEEIKPFQQENMCRLRMKEIELEAHLNVFKEYLNPLTYINFAIEKISFLEQLAAAIPRAGTAVKEMFGKTKKE